MRYWFGKLATEWKAHGRTIAEVGIVVLFSLIPLIIATLSHNAQLDGFKFELNTIVSDSIGSGQLYLYSFSMVGTLIWLSFIRWDIAPIPPRRILGVVVLIGAFIITGLVGIDPSLEFKNDIIVQISYYTYAITILLYYLLVFFSYIEPPEPADTIDSGTKKLVENYENLENG